MKTEVRMDKPEDALAKRQAAYACDVIHEFHNLEQLSAVWCK